MSNKEQPEQPFTEPRTAWKSKEGNARIRDLEQMLLACRTENTRLLNELERAHDANDGLRDTIDGLNDTIQDVISAEDGLRNTIDYLDHIDVPPTPSLEVVEEQVSKAQETLKALIHSKTTKFNFRNFITLRWGDIIEDKDLSPEEQDEIQDLAAIQLDLLEALQKVSRMKFLGALR